MNIDLGTVLANGGSALLGALVGVWGATRIEKQRAASCRRAIRQAIRLDIFRWFNAADQMVDSGRAVLRPTNGLDWWAVAGEAGECFPQNLYALIFNLYSERETLEHAYELALGDGVPAKDVEPVLFAFKRWALLAQETIKRWDSYESRSRPRRYFRRLFPTEHERTGRQAEIAYIESAHKVIGAELMPAFPDKVTADGELKSAVEMLARAREARATSAPPTPSSTAERRPQP